MTLALPVPGLGTPLYGCITISSEYLEGLDRMLDARSLLGRNNDVHTIDDNRESDSARPLASGVAVGRGAMAGRSTLIKVFFDRGRILRNSDVPQLPFMTRRGGGRSRVDETIQDWT